MPVLQAAVQIVGARAARLGNALQGIAALDEQPGVLQRQSLGVTPSLLRLCLSTAPGTRKTDRGGHRKISPGVARGLTVTFGQMMSRGASITLQPAWSDFTSTSFMSQ